MNQAIQIGIGSYTFTWAIGVPGYPPSRPLSVYDLIEKATTLQAPVVQLADNIPLDNFSEEGLSELLRLTEKRSIRLEVGSKGLTTQRLKKYIQITRRLHSDTLRFVIDEAGYYPSPQQVVQIITSLLPELEAAQIRLVLENHDRLKAKEFVFIIHACNSRHVGICLDTVNSLGVPEGTEEVIRELLPYTFNLHIKDFQIERLPHKMGFSIAGTPAGKGKLDIKRIMSELNTIGQCPSAILELWTPFRISLEETIRKENEWAIESMNYLTQLKYE
ncbi:sugar phosphate isomerase/epimerase family protein [Parabacteroides pacaensis]|uniref:sugar phosphate isomerase/epimerase family protein n=1 Tax=Parabacteroides pacaensis TaxID=2086575 RepID=UPI000D1120D7|nr:TIM barrel protein [Parabacteroides pacaensis]